MVTPPFCSIVGIISHISFGVNYPTEVLICGLIFGGQNDIFRPYLK